ncbi:hypothetical protein TNCV_103171 [Trichonephila clavipes]|nr:hypothetical protein TNCV_103171 [Trichonephila clavipes]
MAITCGRGYLVVKVIDSRPVFYECEPSTAEDPPCSGAMHVKSIESSNVLPFVWRGTRKLPRNQPLSLLTMLILVLRLSTPASGWLRKKVPENEESKTKKVMFKETNTKDSIVGCIEIYSTVRNQI